MQILRAARIGKRGETVDQAGLLYRKGANNVYMKIRGHMVILVYLRHWMSLIVGNCLF